MQAEENNLSHLYLINPALNKGTAFTQAEREKFKLDGLIPCTLSTIDMQLQRTYGNFKEQPTPLAKWVYLNALQNRNETLFYRLVMTHLKEMVPYIYTPTVGDVSLRYSTLYEGGRGLFISYEIRHKIDAILDHLTSEKIDVIVVTDGERILGLGDLGVGGMAISVGKLALYTLFGGIHPRRTMPIVLDVGTNNEELLSDSLYVGWRHARIRKEEYLEFVDQFVKGVKKRLPHVLLQWEDFGKTNARPLLEKYRREICSFNDDIQGTASVALAAILSAVKLDGGHLEDQKIVVFGAGSAGMGICDVIYQAMVVGGVDPKKAKKAFYVIDRHGLAHSETSHLEEHQKLFAREFEEVQSWGKKNPKEISLLEVIENAHPTILIGVSAQPGAFTQEVVETMAKFTPRPVIFPLSNPTSKAEAIPSDLLKWTQGRAIIATGSPFPPVEYQGKTYSIAQCNNVYIFPGVGLGVISSQAVQVTEGMFLRAAEILSAHSPMCQDPFASLFPSLESLRAISQKIALAVGLEAIKEGLAPPITEKELEEKISQNFWFPNY